jgi:hypothetical protein
MLRSCFFAHRRFLIISAILATSIYAQQPVSAPVSQTNKPVATLRLEDGTPVKLRLRHTLSSADAQIDDRIDFDVLEEVKVDDVVVIPKGGIAWGRVTQAEPKRGMGRSGKLAVGIDTVRLADGEKAALRGVRNVKGVSQNSTTTSGDVATSLITWPATTLLGFVRGKDVTMPKGTEITVYINGDRALEAAKFGVKAATEAVPAAPATPPAATAGPPQPTAQPPAPASAASEDLATIVLKSQQVHGQHPLHAAPVARRPHASFREGGV